MSVCDILDIRMQKICLDFEWKYKKELDESASMGIIPSGCTDISLPFCANAQKAYFFRQLELTGFDAKTSNVQLELQGLQGVATVFVNGHRVSTLSGAYHILDITPYVDGEFDVLMIAVDNAYGDASISGSVNVNIVDSQAFIKNNGLAVITQFCSQNFSQLDIKVDLGMNALFESKPTLMSVSRDPIDEASYDKKIHGTHIEIVETNPLHNPNLQADVLVEIFNTRGKRVTKRLKKLKLKKDTLVEFKKIKINRPHLYSPQTPNLYSCKATMFVDGVVVSTEQTVFGIRTFSVRKKKFAINNRLIWLNGLKLDWQNGLMGAASTLILEKKKIEKIKSYGYNALQINGLPSEAFLQACDQAGMLCMVELVDGFFAGKPFDSFVFEREHKEILQNYVKVLRNHPSVIIYSIADCNGYTYGRNDGINFAKQIIDIIKSNDSTRPITASVTELLPTVQEVGKYSQFGVDNVKHQDFVSIAPNIAKDKDIFRYATKEFCELLDFVSYKNISHRYTKDLELFDKRQILGVGTPSDKMDVIDIDELKYQDRILGDFSDGTDFDIMSNAKPSCVYRQILHGDKNKSMIATYSPELKNPNISQGQESWDYPQAFGEKIVVDVFTGGDVVALYLDDEIVGRQLAGRALRRKTRFEVDYKPGVLKAISYYKGSEQTTDELASVGFAKSVRLSTDKKTLNLFDKRNLVVVDISVVDKDNRVVNFAAREIIVTTSPECEIVGAGNADPSFKHLQPINGEYTVPVYDGKAQIVVRGLIEGKATLIASSAGLRTARLRLNVKTILPKTRQGQISSEIVAKV